MAQDPLCIKLSIRIRTNGDPVDGIDENISMRDNGDDIGDTDNDLNEVSGNSARG